MGNVLNGISYSETETTTDERGNVEQKKNINYSGGVLDQETGDIIFKGGHKITLSSDKLGTITGASDYIRSEGTSFALDAAQDIKDGTNNTLGFVGLTNTFVGIGSFVASIFMPLAKEMAKEGVNISKTNYRKSIGGVVKTELNTYE
ncbi:hypothetical protein [Robertkochia solimangrovi]|uniref:hypothetical protein n=1 Tax=Robertkochia solimangrovi TaxID=2213046 RepID=UPI0011809F90|nr:hypothetical protein [Robertkochia solimangrovi]TRZ41647.1 hypothetical protein DMZ48_16700 [Robertkochia solimangrovi]